MRLVPYFLHAVSDNSLIFTSSQRCWLLVVGDGPQQLPSVVHFGYLSLASVVFL